MQQGPSSCAHLRTPCIFQQRREDGSVLEEEREEGVPMWGLNIMGAVRMEEMEGENMVMLPARTCQTIVTAM